MQLCKEHWERLKKAIADKGMSHLVAKSSEELASRLNKEIKNEHTVHDPLMAANMGIFGNALQQGGLYLMGRDEDGNQYCPLCEVKKHVSEDMDEKWIQASTDEQLEKCKAAGLLSNN